MRILFATEGTYPYVMGGVSTWCDQLIRGLQDHSFTVMPVLGPTPAPAWRPPANVETTLPIHIWRPREGVPEANRMQILAFDESLTQLLTFLEDDLCTFARGVTVLSRLGSACNLWPLFQRPSVWRLLHGWLERLFGKRSSLAELSLCVNWLQSAVSPLLFVPPKSDLAHTVSNGLSAIPAFIASQVYGIPLVLTEHGVYLRERYLAFSAEATPPVLKRFCTLFYRAVARLIYRKADRVLSVSTFNRTWQLELGAAEERTFVIPNGVEVGAFPTAYNVTHDIPTVSWVGRIDPLKDLETLIRAFAMVKQRSPEARLRLFGPIPKGNEAYHKGLTELLSTLSLTSCVTFEGPVKPVYQAYHAGDVIALSSVSEGFPFTIIEAMMCGKPVVATRVGGVAEALGDTGRLTPAQNPEAFAKALLELLEDAELRRNLGKAAHERARSLFTLERILDLYRRVYADLSAPAVQAQPQHALTLASRPRRLQALRRKVAP